MIYFVQLADGGVLKYDGMTEDAIRSLLDSLGRSYSFITEQQYNTAIGR